MSLFVRMMYDGSEAKQYFKPLTPTNELLREAILEVVYYNSTLIKKASTTFQFNVTFKNKTLIRDEYKLYLITDYATTELWHDKEEEEEPQYSRAHRYTTQVGLTANFAIAVFQNKGMELVFGMLNFIQLITLLPIIPIYMPDHTRWLLRKLEFSNMDFDIFKTIYLKIRGLENWDDNSISYTFLFADNDIF